MSDRTRILETLISTLEPMTDVLAFWEAGSRATGRYDQYSDLDLQILVADGSVEPVRTALEAALLSLAPFEKRWEVPAPTFHGNWQCFYHLRGTDPLLLVDLCLIEQKAPNRFLEPEMHGIPTVFFDKIGAVRPEPTDAAAHAEKIRRRLPLLEEPMELFHAFVDKELLRGREVDAFAFYHGYVLSRLVEALRMRYAPWRYNFGPRYLQYDLPPAVYARVRSFYFLEGGEDLGRKKAEALQWLRETLAEVKQLDLIKLLEETR
ncbi:MAG TPA: hypothetical protein VNT75_15505 [Symbiobacteriaceae bacterium]|nr:hypothetical protein [Symbiobacteriaceae bacterium]